MRYVPSIFAVIAIWLIAAPFLLGYQDTTNALRNDVTVGMVMLLTAIWWGFRELKDQGWYIHVAKNSDQHDRTT